MKQLKQAKQENRAIATTASPSYTGKALHIDLSLLTFNIEDIPTAVYENLVGGKGLGIYFLMRTPKGCKPLSPENDLIFVTGPLTGTLAPCSVKFGVVTKGPATNGFLDAYTSGDFGDQLKFAGFDALILHGAAKISTVVTIDDHNIEFHPAQQLGVVGVCPLETEIKIKAAFGSGYACGSIGLAGEKQVIIAGIFFEQRCAGRGGAGAVMGSKNIKAIAVKGTNAIHLANPEEFKQAAWIARRYLRSGEITVRAMPREGTANIVEIVNERFAFPTHNFQGGQFQGTDHITGSAWRQQYWEAEPRGTRRSGTTACHGCLIGCSKIAYLKTPPTDIFKEFDEYSSSLKREIAIDGPEYETIALLGPNVGNDNPEVLLLANYLCDYYGIDTISTGNIIGFVMELYEKQLITPQELDGIIPNWGDKSAILRLIQKIGRAEGCGRMLGNGVKKMAEQYPAGQAFAMEIKGLEMPGYEPRGANGMALCYALSDRGACHIHAFTASVEVMGNAGGADPFDLGPKKLDLFINLQAESTLTDCAVLCFFVYNGMQAKEVLAMLAAATGFKQFLEQGITARIAQRVLTLTRLYNLREGLSRKDDMPPPRIITEGQNSGPAKNRPVKNFEQALLGCYHAMGWDDQGVPTAEIIQTLGLDMFFKK